LPDFSGQGRAIIGQKAITGESLLVLSVLIGKCRLFDYYTIDSGK
jgi:hypothetical protein